VEGMKILYEEKYKKGAKKLTKDELLFLIHRNNPRLLNGEINTNGVGELPKKDGGNKVQYMDLRVYFECTS
jgi:hypothetical protein